MLCSLPVRMSRAVTFRIPLASIRNRTSMRAIPAGIGSMSFRSKRARLRQSLASSRSPWTHVDQHVLLAVHRRGEHLGGAGRNGRVAVDQLGHGAAHRLDAERQRRHVQQQLVLDLARQNARLHRRAQRHHLVGIQFGVRLGAEQGFHGAAHHRNARRPAHQHHLVDLLDRHARVPDAAPARPQRPVDDSERSASRRARA